MCILPVSEGGKPSFTSVKILQKGYYHFNPNNNIKNDDEAENANAGTTERIPVTKVLLYPKTGRRHQLRVHLQHIGHSILGDYNYESPHTDTFRMMLHAYKIQLPLPSPFSHINLETPDPFDNLIHDIITEN
ncbi:unnamed protein product [Cunninghamella echinulata]